MLATNSSRVSFQQAAPQQEPAACRILDTEHCTRFTMALKGPPLPITPRPPPPQLTLMVLSSLPVAYLRSLGAKLSWRTASRWALTLFTSSRFVFQYRTCSREAVGSWAWQTKQQRGSQQDAA